MPTGAAVPAPRLRTAGTPLHTAAPQPAARSHSRWRRPTQRRRMRAGPGDAGPFLPQPWHTQRGEQRQPTVSEAPQESASRARAERDGVALHHGSQHPPSPLPAPRSTLGSSTPNPAPPHLSGSPVASKRVLGVRRREDPRQRPIRRRRRGGEGAGWRAAALCRVSKGKGARRGPVAGQAARPGPARCSPAWPGPPRLSSASAA